MASAGQSTEQARPGQDIDAIPTLAWSARPDGSAELLNRRWLDYTGLSAEEASDRGWTVALHTEDRDRFVEFWRHLLDSGEGAEIEARLPRYDGEYRWFASEAMNALCNYRWPGNIQELQNVVERAVILASGPMLRVSLSDLTAAGGLSSKQSDPVKAENPGNLRRLLDETERQRILEVLDETRWVIAGPRGAAAHLGVKRSTLQARILKLGIARNR